MEAIPLRTSVLQTQDDQGTQRRFNITVPNSQAPQVVVQISNISSSQPDLFDDTKAHTALCVPLHKATLRGDWDEANRIIAQHPNILTSGIALGGRTVLHVAVGTGNVRFVEHLVRLLSVNDLELRDEKNNTALCDAAIAAPVEIAKLMIGKNLNLPTMRGGVDMLPVYMAALFKRSEMAWYLYDKSEESFDENDRIGLFFTCIDTDIYDLALKMVKDNLSLAFARDDKHKTTLHHLAVTPTAFAGQSLQGWTKIFESWLNFKFRSNSTQTTAIELVKCLWDQVLNLGRNNAMELIRTPSELLFDATRIGNSEFLQVLVSSYPDLVWETNIKNQTIIHIAVQYRQPDIFNMIHVIVSKKQVISTYEDDERATTYYI